MNKEENLDLMKRIYPHIKVIFFLSLYTTFIQAASYPDMSASEIQLALKKLNVLGSALYLAAHPDDENTALLSYLSKEKLVRTAYLSLTRGDGGQNLIGTEAGDLLGVLRTQELLAARRIDGAEQFFTRAIDFGYSKTPEESIEMWDEEKVLADIVWIVRQFRPDVIITRFTPDRGGHGHHRASAILALEAFRAAADPQKFPEQLSHVDIWQTKRLFWNVWRPAITGTGLDTTRTPYLDLGTYNPLLGKSYGELYAVSRSMHKSQGFGASPWRGSYREYFLLMAGDFATSDIFENVNLSWSRIPDGQPLKKLIDQAYHEFNPENPADIIPLLLKIYTEMDKLPDLYWKNIKKNEVLKILKSCLGLWFEASAESPRVTPGSSLQIELSTVNRSNFILQLDKIGFSSIKPDSNIKKQLKNNIPLVLNTSIHIPDSMSISQPYWLREKSGIGTYTINNIQSIGLPENPPALSVSFTFNVQGVLLKYITPVIYKWTDPVDGEKQHNLEIEPTITAEFMEKVYLFPENIPKQIPLKVRNVNQDRPLKIQLDIPCEWEVKPAEITLSPLNKDEEQIVYFTITPPETTTSCEVMVSYVASISTMLRHPVRVDYNHIPIQTVYPVTSTTFTRIQYNKQPWKIGYIMGAGDEIPSILMQLGFLITELKEDNIEQINLSDFNTIIAGIRAYNTNDWLKNYQNNLIKYVENGGTYIIQYNVTRGLVTDALGPYPFVISHDRVSEEKAAVQFLVPDHPLLNYPYKLTAKDFENWVQERGLYFANNWDARYQTPLTSNDTGETPKPGGILYTRYGKGVFIYTGYSFFRQFPAGVPGSIKLFINMILSRLYDDRKENHN